VSKNLPSGHFLVLCVGAAFLFTAFFMAGTLAPLYAAFIAAPPALIGIVVSAMFVLPLGLAIPVGTLTDRISPRIMLVVGLIVIASAPIALALRPSLTTLLLMQVLVGLGQLAAVLGAQKSVTRFRAGRSREAAFGWYSAFVSLGQMLGPIVAGSLVDFRGFQTAFVATAAVAVGGAVAFALLRLPPAESQDSFESKPRERRRPGTALVRLLGLESVQVSLVVSATVMIVMVAHNSFLPAFLEGFAVPATVIGAVVSARSLAAAIVRTFISQIVRSLGGRMTTFVVMLSLAGAGVAGIGLGPSLVAQLTARSSLGLPSVSRNR